jgi:hypothetical protein
MFNDVRQPAASILLRSLPNFRPFETSKLQMDLEWSGRKGNLLVGAFVLDF